MNYNAEPEINAKKMIEHLNIAEKYLKYHIGDHIYKKIKFLYAAAFWEMGYTTKAPEYAQKTMALSDSLVEYCDSLEDSNEYAKAVYYKGKGHRLLSWINENRDELIAAIDSYDRALDFLDSEWNPDDYARVYHRLGNAYRELARFDNKNEYLQKAYKAYAEALRVRDKKGYSFWYAETLMSIGETDLLEARIFGDADALDRAEKSFRRSLITFTSSDYPIYHQRAENNLKQVRRLKGKFD